MIHWRWFGSDEPDVRTALAYWAASKIWPEGDRDLQWFGENLVMGVFENSDPIAAVVYHNWEPNAGVIEISGASTAPRWLTRSVLREMYRYAFEEVGVQMVVQRTPAENERLLRILNRVGFKFYRIPRLRGRELDEMVCTLTDDDWKRSKFANVTKG